MLQRKVLPGAGDQSRSRTFAITTYAPAVRGGWTSISSYVIWLLNRQSCAGVAVMFIGRGPGLRAGKLCDRILVLSPRPGDRRVCVAHRDQRRQLGLMMTGEMSEEEKKKRGGGGTGERASKDPQGTCLRTVKHAERSGRQMVASGPIGRAAEPSGRRAVHSGAGARTRWRCTPPF